MIEKPYRVRVIAVHGTWGRGIFRKYRTARWCSPFCDELERLIRQQLPSVEVILDPFIWSGKNSIYERSAAAKFLAERLSAEHEFDASIVVGHSHGGNVGLLALTGANYAQGTHYLVTLATPFVRVFSAEVPKDVWYKLPYTWLAGLAFFIGIIGLAPWLAGNGPVSETLLIIAALLFASLSAIPTLRRLQGVKEAKRDRLTRATAVDAFKLGDRVLVVRGVDDEASLALAAGSLAARVGSWLNTMVGGIVMYTALFPLIYGFMSALEALALANAPMSIMLVLPLLGFYMVLFFPFAAPFFRGVFGPELFFLSAGCQVAVDSAPDGDQSRIATIASEEPHNRRAWTHFIYDNPKCVNATADWLVRMLAIRIAGFKPEQHP